jgi:hypothetical protein
MAVDVPGRPRVLGIGAWLLPILLAVPNLSEAQSGCTYDLYTSDMVGFTDFNHQGGSSFIRLDTQPGCRYAVQTSDPFVTLINDAFSVPSGIATSHSQYIRFSVAPNPSVRWRRATINIPTDAVEIRQAGHPRVIDFNGDRNTDILWHHRGDGRIGTWLMNNVQRIGAMNFSPAQVADTNWILAGGGDLNGDGHADLVWRHTDGRVAAWLMNRLQMRSAELLSVPVVADPEWRIRSVFDFNADGYADILWQHQTQGVVGIWYMNGVRVLEARAVNGPVVSDPDWVLVGATPNIARYNPVVRDPVLIWHHQGTGDLAAWIMSGSTAVAAEIIGRVADTNWKLRGLPDLNQNGYGDFLWHHQVDGRVGLWPDGDARRTNVDYTPVPDTNWHLAGPR